MPREIRDMIYECYFEDAAQRLRWDQPRFFLKWPKGASRGVLLMHKPDREYEIAEIPNDLIATSRKLHNEALLQLYKMVEFRVDVSQIHVSDSSIEKNYQRPNDQARSRSKYQDIRQLWLNGFDNDRCRHILSRLVCYYPANQPRVARAFWQVKPEQFWRLQHVRISGSAFDRIFMVWVVRKCAIHCLHSSTKIDFTVELHVPKTSPGSIDLDMQTVIEGKNGYQKIVSRFLSDSQPSQKSYSRSLPLTFMELKEDKDKVEFPPNLKSLRIDDIDVDPANYSTVQDFRHGNYVFIERNRWRYWRWPDLHTPRERVLYEWAQDPDTVPSEA
ncbi:MAG: hypothetical protein Q9227_006408 [Pyrenula ochraceoflavens]